MELERVTSGAGQGAGHLDRICWVVAERVCSRNPSHQTAVEATLVIGLAIGHHPRIRFDLLFLFRLSNSRNSPQGHANGLEAIALLSSLPPLPVISSYRSQYREALPPTTLSTSSPSTSSPLLSLLPSQLRVQLEGPNRPQNGIEPAEL
ncbi:hypothetical protein V6N11_028713 [Hibiscus sabdariffa]|uniref:Uncharacterized protein n=1 Tax=Hibiscus sabdariffa TaxID=183260 RepID=A0ABR2PR34_9ROSI